MARVDNLSNFLTDVANAIRTKTGSSETIQASSFDTAISNIPSGSSISSWDDAINGFNDYLEGIKENYTPYTNDSITIYSYNSKCPYYMIQKRSNGKYRIVWHCLPYSYLENNSYQDFANPIIGFPTTQSYLTKTVDNLSFSITGSVAREDMDGYYSNEFDTLELLITAIQNSTGSGITYTYFNSNVRYTGVLDSEWLTPITNTVIFENDLKTVVTYGKVISHNETISFLN